MQLSAQQVRSKTRNAVRRREDAIEDEETQSGEINLIPYLDMVTNLMLFLLFSISSGIVFTQIDTTLPDKAPPNATVSQQTTDNPDDKPLGLFVSVTTDRVIIWSVSGLEGTLAAPKIQLNRTGRDGDRCDGNYMCENNTCDGESQKCVASREHPAPLPQPVFDYRAINKTLHDIAKARYNGKLRKANTYAITLQASDKVPYGTITSVMAAMRCQMPDFGKEVKGCLLPGDNKQIKAAKNPIDKDNFAYDTDRAPYDADTMALFGNIGFSSGFE